MDETAERSPLTEPWFVASAAFVAVLAAALVVLIAAHVFGHHRKPAASVKVSHKSSPTPVATASNPNGCSLAAGSQTIPTTAPAAQWVTVGDMQAPQAPASVGPQRTVSGVGVCFEHSPLGALYAAVNFFAAGTSVPQATLLEQLAAPSRFRAELIAQSKGSGAEIQEDDGNPGAIAVAGFSITDYTSAAEDLTVVLSGPGGQLAAVQMSEQWQAGDWKVEIPAGLQLTATAAGSLAGFIPWSAE
jgi:hypothetical protein